MATTISNEDSSEKSEKVAHLVVDSGPFIKNVDINALGENLYAISDALTEIRDKETRQRLKVLPFTLRFREPSQESIKIISDFAKLTGDYSVLSSTDIRVLALTYQLEREYVGVDHLNREPKKTHVGVRQTENEIGKEKESEKSNLPGFYSPPDDENEASTEALEEKNELEGSDEEQNSESDDTGDEGWIMPSNFRSVKEKLEGLHISSVEESRPVVACCTTDFAMQNVLIQMGLKLVSSDGCVIKHARTYILRCYACYTTTSDMTKVFCPGCGNRGTLKRVAVAIDENGDMQMFINFKRPINTRGLRWSIPKMKGGKHAKDPILSEYQPRPQQRVSKKARQKLNPLDADYEAGDSPFTVKDVYSRSALMGLRATAAGTYGPLRNPYMNRKPTGNKKKR